MTPLIKFITLPKLNLKTFLKLGYRKIDLDITFTRIKLILKTVKIKYQNHLREPTTRLIRITNLKTFLKGLTKIKKRKGWVERKKEKRNDRMSERKALRGGCSHYPRLEGQVDAQFLLTRPQTRDRLIITARTMAFSCRSGENKISLKHIDQILEMLWDIKKMFINNSVTNVMIIM